MSLTNPSSLEMYRKMLLVRSLEAKLQELCMAGEAGDLHFNKGQEAISIGVCSALRPDDYIVTHHRTISHAIAKGVPLKPLVAELLGKETGICGGLAGEMHLYYPPKGYMFSFQLVGTAVPVAAGLAWATRYHRKEDKITALFIGDASTSNAQFHEGLNLAALEKVPLLIIVEDNHLAGNIGQEYYLPTSLKDRFTSYGIEAIPGDGNHIDEVVAKTQRYGAKVREESRPVALIFDTTRLCLHKQGQRDMRPPEVLIQLEDRDPIKYMETFPDIKKLDRDKMREAARIEVEDAIEEARNANWPRVD